jgi:uncharacterized OsmC-like protein
MYDTTVKYRSGVAFEVTARGHRLLCDQPFEAGGDDSGMTPPELMLASLATCAGYYIVQYLKVRNLPVDGLAVLTRAHKAQQPARLGAFQIVIHPPPGMGDRELAGIRRAAEKCLIHNTLLHPPSIEIEVVPSRSEQVGIPGSVVGEALDGGGPGGVHALR